MKKLLWVSLAVLAMGTTAGCTVDDTYANCVSDGDCNDLDDTCERLTLVEVGTGFVLSDGASCTHSCLDDFDCESNFGFSGACYALGGRPGDPFLCYQRCDFDEDCDFAQICIELVRTTDGFLDFVCAPDNF